MSDASGDRGLERLFARLREAERRESPSFEETWSLARATVAAAPARRARKSWMLSAAAAILLGALALYLRLRADRAEQPGADALAMARAVSSWSAPTDALLTYTPYPSLDSVPTLELSTVSIGGLR